MAGFLIHWLGCALVISTFTCGLRLTTQEGMIFERLFVGVLRKRNPMDPNSAYVMPAWIRKPLIGCVYCMPSFWGTIIFWLVTYLFVGMAYAYIVTWVLSIFSASFINTILYGYVDSRV